MIPAPTVLVPIDEPNSIASLPVARSFADMMGATVVLIHVGPERLSPLELVDRLRLSPDDVHGLVIEQCAGSPAAAIVGEATARHSLLVVMGASAQPFEGVVGDVLRTAPCPVVLVPAIAGQRSWSLRQAVLPHDGTPMSAAAIAPTADLVSRAGAELVVLHVATSDLERPVERGTFITPRYLDQPHHEWEAWAREFLDRVRGLGHPAADVVKLRLVLAKGRAEDAILAFAQCNPVDLIALAWRGSVERERARTIRRVLEHARCPVIVFRVPV